nr:hypothetical protein 3 [Pseudomonadaceae bacterium]
MRPKRAGRAAKLPANYPVMRQTDESLGCENWGPMDNYGCVNRPVTRIGTEGAAGQKEWMTEMCERIVQLTDELVSLVREHHQTCDSSILARGLPLDRFYELDSELFAACHSAGLPMPTPPGEIPHLSCIGKTHLQGAFVRPTGGFLVLPDRWLSEMQALRALAVAKSKKARKKSRKRGERAEKTERLKNEMCEHLRAARDHAFARMDQTGEPELLPRPTQKDLAERVGVSESDVSRCLNDPTAQELKLYWETALDLNQIMKWKGAIAAGRQA